MPGHAAVDELVGADERGREVAAVEDLVAHADPQRGDHRGRGHLDVHRLGEVDGRPLSDEELVFTIMLLFIGGIETTTHALSNIGHHLATRPDLWAQLQSDRGLIPSAIEEFLRYEAIAVGPRPDGDPRRGRPRRDDPAG